MEGAKTMLIIILSLIAVFAALFGAAFIAIIWTYRPDLSVLDILREAVKELKNRK